MGIREQRKPSDTLSIAPYLQRIAPLDISGEF